MLVNEKNQNLLIASHLTIITTFLMGFIDAYTFIEHGGSFASAQTGNIITMSVKFFSGNFIGAANHLIVLAGYGIGAFIGEALIERFDTKSLYKSRIILLFQAILLGILALFQSQLDSSLMICSLGLLAGYEITVFRNFRGTNVNNGIMTGNTKNMMNNLYKVIFNKDKKARTDFFHLVIVIIVFIIGAGSGVLILELNTYLNLWVAFGIVFIALLYTVIKGTEK